MNEDERLKDLLKVERPAAFWAAQKARILGRIAPRAASPWRPWAPVLAGALAAALYLRGTRAPEAWEAPPPSDWAMLENLELLEDLETLETLEDNDA